MLSSLTISAQPSEYHHVGDTINGRSPIYYYQWWSEAWLADTSHRLTVLCEILETLGGPMETYQIFHPGGFHGEMLQFYYTDIPIQIIGIATTCVTKAITSYWLDYDGELLYPEYLRLYDATEDDFHLIKEVQYDRHTPKRYMNLDLRVLSELEIADRCCYWENPDRIKTMDIREYYFDKPVTVTDSFYLGHTIENNYGWTRDIHLDMFDHQMITIQPGCLVWDEYNVQYPGSCNHYCGSTQNQLKNYRNILWDMVPTSPTYGDTIDSLSIWRWAETPYYMLEFPIVVIDSSYIIPPYECPPVTNLRIADMSEGKAVLYWDTHADHNSWQTCYGPQGTPPDDCTRINNPIQVSSIMGLDSCTHYDAYVRGVCYHDSTCYSDWVGPIDIFICDTTSSGGDGGDGGGDSLRTVSALNVLTNIVPNPASMQATVYSSFEVSHISAFDANGKMVLDTSTSGHSSTLDIKSWAPGIYIVVIHTPAGRVAKKLVVSGH